MSSLVQNGGIKTDPTVVEGGTIEITVTSTAKEVFVVVPGHSDQRVPVVGGKAEYSVPAGVPGGTIIIVTDGVSPRPSASIITVVGNHSCAFLID